MPRRDGGMDGRAGGGVVSTVRRLQQFKFRFFCVFFVGVMNWSACLQCTATLRREVRRLDCYRPIIRKNSSSYSKAGLFHDQSWSMTRF